MALEDRIRLPALGLIHRRQRLLNMLTEFIETGNRLITIYASGGYGKSILLADFAQTVDLPACWCSLEPADRDPTSFLTLLAYSITDRFRDIEPHRLFQVIERGDTQAGVHRLTELLANVGPHIIIIDDYHKAVSAGMTLALNRLLEQLPESSAVIVAARGDLNLETGQIIDLLIADQVAGLSEDELRFTPKELQRVMLKRFGRRIDLTEAQEIAQATDGNIAQILLTGHIARAQHIVGNLRGRLGDDQEIIYSFLADEVFGKQPAALRHFMLYTSVLPEMTVELCNELLGITGAQSYLETLIRKDLFVAQVGTGFRYHDLFTGFLRSKLGEDETVYRQVTVKAGRLLAERSRFEEAIELYLSAKAWNEAAKLLEAEGKFFYDTGRALTLNHWLSEISEDELTQYPRLLLLQGKILNDDLGEPYRAITVFQQAEAQFQEHNDFIGMVEAQILCSVALRMIGKPEESLDLVGKGVDRLENLKANQPVLAWAIKNRGLAYSVVGNTAAALSDLRWALALFEDLDDTYRVGMCHHDIGVCLFVQGNISGADYHYRRAIRIWEALGNANDLANTLNSLGVSQCTVGNYEESLLHFSHSLDIALQIGATRRAAFAQAGIGDTYLGCEEFEQAVEAYKLSIRLAEQAEVHSLKVYNLVKIGESFYRQNDQVRALKTTTQVRDLAAELGLYQEQGLACALLAKIYVSQGEYQAGSNLFAEALTYFAQNDVLEQAKVRLWWGYSLLLDLKASAAFKQLHQAIKLILSMGELLPLLGSTVTETKPLLLHFLYRTDIAIGIRDSVRLLLAQETQKTTSSKLNIQVFAFGVPSVIVGDSQKQFSQRGRARKMPEFLLYLLLEGQSGGCRWDEVCAAIWPELPPDKSSQAFHYTLRRLREVVFENPDYLIRQDDYYLLEPRCLEWCDVLAFELLLERAARVSPQEALNLYLEVIELYQGPFLAGFDLEEWGFLYRSRCETRFLQTVKLAAEALLQQDNPQKALEVINKGLAQDYFREDLHRAAFKAYRQLELFDHLTTCYGEMVATFQREFGLPPQPATIELYKQLINQRECDGPWRDNTENENGEAARRPSAGAPSLGDPTASPNLGEGAGG